MPLVQAKCENCGGILEVDSNLKAANCPHCGAAYVVQDAINYFHSVTNIDHLHADIVNINDEKTSVGRLKAAESHMKVNEYQAAQKEFNKATGLTPQDYRGWWGLLRCGVAERRSNDDEPELETLIGYAKYVESFAPVDVRSDLMDMWNEYLGSESVRRDKLTQLKYKNNLKATLQHKRGVLQRDLDNYSQIANAKVGMPWWMNIYLFTEIIGLIGYLRGCVFHVRNLTTIDVLGELLFIPATIFYLLFLFIVGPRVIDKKMKKNDAVSKVGEINNSINENETAHTSVINEIEDLEKEIEDLSNQMSDIESKIISKTPVYDP